MRWRKDITTSTEQAKWYDQKFQEMGQCWQTPTEEIDAHLDRMGLGRVSRGSRYLLDLGCGDGSFVLRALRRDQVWAWGIDLSEVAIAWAMEKRNSLAPLQRGHCHFIHGEMGEQMRQFPCKSFDYVVSMGSIEHVLEIDDVLAQIARVVKPLGVVYLYVPNELWVHEDQPTELVATEVEWEELLEKHGIVVGYTKRLGDNSVVIGRKG